MLVGAAGLGVAGAAATAAVLLDGPAARRGADLRPARRLPTFGILQAEPEQYPDLRRAGLGMVTLNVPWDRVAPERGSVDTAFVEEVLRRLDAAREAGLRIAVIPGDQYPPEWVFDLGRSGGRFVDQHGRHWHGEVGDDVADVVFDPDVAEAHEEHLRWLGGLLSAHEPEVVRAGGLARGELHYPFTDRDGVRNTFWAYGQAAQERSPVPGFRPGTGTEDDAAGFVSWYLDELAGFGRRQLDVLRDVFGPGPTLLVLQPSWGLRPGDVEEAVATGLDGSSPAELRGTLTEGLDWQRQAPLLAAVPDVGVCTTWLDTPDQGDDPDEVSPGRYLAGVAAEHGLPVWGENTGGNSAEDLRRCVALVDELELDGLFWMGARDLGRAGNADLDDYREAVAARDAAADLTPGDRP